MLQRLHNSILMRLWNCMECKTIVSDRDVHHKSYFWKILWHKMRTKLKFSNAFHPQTDSQTEVVNWRLGNLLRCLIGGHNRNWDLLLPHVQFAYNSLVNRSIGMSPFEVVYGFSKHKPVNFLPLLRLFMSRILLNHSFNICMTFVRALGSICMIIIININCMRICQGCLKNIMLVII